MKRILLALSVIILACQARGQQLFQQKPQDSLRNNLFEQYLKVIPNTQFQLWQPLPKNLQFMAAVKQPVQIAAYDHMPVAAMPGHSKMPVVKLSSGNKMPVLKPGGSEVQPFAVKPITP